MTKAEIFPEADLKEFSSVEDDAFWGWAETTLREDSPESRLHDLEERTARFGEGAIDFVKTIPQGPVTNRSIDTCRKEARETKFFLRMAARRAFFQASGESALVRGPGIAPDFL